ncbi:MAG: thioredoxin domain-containing protein [Acetobacteraceae bacterium]|nr:thioredoxin domain-containing protein [Acetobacteraceae bacterium]
MNLLRHEKSPYLLQHAGNPVHWRPWGEAALAEARASNRPILLSIGYAACHWCHVMAHESFEDEETAALMNQLFVSIKVDREERPDIDHLYMAALQALGERGGWPLTMFLTPDGAPFWGGTYFPPEPRWGRPSFRQVLQGVANAFRGGDAGVAHNASALVQAMASLSATTPGDALTPGDLDRVSGQLLATVDPVRGGMGGAPKFPNPPSYRFLWQEHFRTGRAAYADAVRLLLRQMSQGGIYDHLGGGYARYSTDAEWLVPHFEKMLYDNAQILELLALAAADVPDPLFAERAEETVGWLLRDMAVEGAFAASEDADSEGEEGKFYVWSEAEVDASLGADAALFKRAYDVTTAGNWEGRTILRRVNPPGTAADEAALARGRDTLFQARAGRIRPGRDDKVLADWNALGVAALCRAGVVFGRPEWLARAAAAFDFVRARMMAPDGRVLHAWREGQVTAPGLLEDQAAMARAGLALFEATGEAARLDQAIGHARAAIALYADADGSFFTSALDAADIPAARPRSAADGATPSGNGTIAEVFARLFHLTGDPAWRRHAEAVIRAFSGADRALVVMPTLLAAADLLEDGAIVVIAGTPDDPAVAALIAAALTAADPALCVLRAPDRRALPPEHPAHGKTAGRGAAAYVCRSGVCGLPVADVPTLRAALDRRPAR